MFRMILLLPDFSSSLKNGEWILAFLVFQPAIISNPVDDYSPM